MIRYPHLNYRAAEQLLATIDAPQSMIVTDGVFSMDGDLAPVIPLHQISKNHGAVLVIDDAHGFGILGPAGGGVLQQHQIPVRDNVLLMGTFGKAAGSFGAFVAGDSDLIEALIQFARPYIYTTALPPSVAATSLTALELMQREPERRVRLLDNVRFFRECAQAAGLTLGDSSTPIQPVFVAQEGDSLRSLNRLNEKLLAAGIWVAMIRPPTVPVGTERLRISLTSEHTREDIERLVGSLQKSIADE
jgi:8-amino-7-oxononanoate synthase